MSSKKSRETSLEKEQLENSLREYEEKTLKPALDIVRRALTEEQWDVRDLKDQPAHFEATKNNEKFFVIVAEGKPGEPLYFAAEGKRFLENYGDNLRVVLFELDDMLEITKMHFQVPFHAARPSIDTAPTPLDWSGVDT